MNERKPREPLSSRSLSQTLLQPHSHLRCPGARGLEAWLPSHVDAWAPGQTQPQPWAWDLYVEEAPWVILGSCTVNPCCQAHHNVRDSSPAPKEPRLVRRGGTHTATHNMRMTSTLGRSGEGLGRPKGERWLPGTAFWRRRCGSWPREWVISRTFGPQRASSISNFAIRVEVRRYSRKHV